MNLNADLVERAEQAARATTKDWIRRALRESFLQALRQAWSIRYNQAPANARDSSSSLQTNKDDDVDDDEEKYRDEHERVGTETRVELSLSGANACLSMVERVSRSWQTKLKEEQHERVAQWVEEAYQEGKSSLWAEQTVDDNDDSNDSNDNTTLNTALDSEQLLKHQREKKLLSHQEKESQSLCSKETSDPTHETDKSLEESIGSPNPATNDSGEEKSLSNVEKDPYHHHHHHHHPPNVYSKLRALGRKRKLDSPGLSIPDALHEIKDFSRNHPTYWPLDNAIIDQACLDMSRRMRARDKHGSGGDGNAGDGSKSYTKKTVRFKVVPKSVWETKQQQQQKQQQRNQDQEAESNKSPIDGDECNESGNTQPSTTSAQENDQASKVETVLLASMKRKKSGGRSRNSLEAIQKRLRISKQQEIPRVPFDVPQSSDGRIWKYLSQEDKNVLDGLLTLDDNEQDANASQSITAAILEAPLALFGGLQHVGQTNHALQNPGTVGGDRVFMARNTDKITRRKEKVSIQERLDPNRLQVGRAENPAKRKSKFLRTEDWFDDQKKFFDFDLGWCLLEIPTQGNHKRLCAFSSMEICLEDCDG
jgi:hypothetical protein